MIKFFANSLEQLDMAVDHLSVGDANNARIALMLIDNVLEINLHRHAKDCKLLNDQYLKMGKEKYNTKAVENANGQHFDAKVKLARINNFMDEDEAASVIIFHQFRNETYHVGVQHEAIIQSVALFYIQVVCDVLIKYPDSYWSWGSRDKIPHRAQKYLDGQVTMSISMDSVNAAWKRLKCVAQNITDNFVNTLCFHLDDVIDDTDSSINFLANDGSKKETRKEVVKSCQVWAYAFSQKGKKFIIKNKGPSKTIIEHMEWLKENYKCPVPTDPIHNWKKRVDNIRCETNHHKALKKYKDFMDQTATLREQVYESACALDGYIQEQVDIARGK